MVRTAVSGIGAARVAVAVAVASLASCRGGCGRHDGPPVAGQDPPAVAKDSPLRLFPADAATVVLVDVAKLRLAPIFGNLARGDAGGAAARAVASLEGELGALAKATGFHPLLDVDSVVVAIAPADQKGGGVVVRGRHLDEKRLLSHLRATKGKDADLVATRRGTRTLWSTRKVPEAGAIFLDDRTLLIGHGGWVERMADLADGVASARPAASNGELVRALAGIAGHAVSGVSLEPGSLERFSTERVIRKSDAGDGDPLRIRRATWTVDAGQKIVGHLDAELADAAGAKALAERWQQTETRGLGSIVSVTADGTKLRADVTLGDEELQKVVLLAGMFATFPLVKPD
jgi:hypothetical protein